MEIVLYLHHHSCYQPYLWKKINVQQQWRATLKLFQLTGIIKTSVHLNKKCLTQIYFSLFHSYINYGNIAWASTTPTKLKQILRK